MADKPMKLSYHRNGTKRNAYLLPLLHFSMLKEQISIYLFADEEPKRYDFRTFWIDEDSDEIDIVNQSDYDIFLKHNKDRLHLQVVPVNDENPKAKEPQNASNPSSENLFPTNAEHTFVECDVCKVKPIVGFRYKCIECNNFDLCQRCEAMHCHPEHMLVRMPHNNCPNIVEAWVTGRTKRSHKKGSRGRCPFVPPHAADMPGTAPGGGDAERHHHSRRSHKRPGYNAGIFGHLYTMMQDFAEGGVNNDIPHSPNEPDPEFKAAAKATVAANEAAASACKAAAETIKVASATLSEAAKPKEQSFNGTVPKTPATTPSAPTESTDVPKPEPNPLLNSPSLESLSQFIDPQYMHAGIQILNNFSEMFAKMLDPNEGAGMSCPFNPSNFSAERKSSSTSTETSSGPASANNEKQKPQESKKSENEVATSTTNSPPASVGNAADLETPERRRSQSIEDSEWQLIDKQADSSMNDNVNDAEVASTSSRTPTSITQYIDFAQLSKDLKAHIEDEKKREDSAQAKTPTPPAVSTNVPVTSTSAPTEVAPTQAPVPQPRVADDKRAVLFYHPDPRINNSVHAMMAMGFSNEGAWLTQLLESVNGNIPEALDLMNAAQRSNK